MAVELARYGVPVRIVDKAARRRDPSRAMVVWSRTVEQLDRAGCGPELSAAGMKVTAANIVAGEKTIGRIDLGGVDNARSYALMLSQSETERLLEERLNELGVQVERGVELTTFASKGSQGVIATLSMSDRTVQRVESSWMIGCDGAQSKVRQGLRMVFTGDAQPSRWFMADVRLSGEREPGEIDVSLHSDGMLAILPITPDLYRVMADVGPSNTAKASTDPTLSEVQALLDNRGFQGTTAFAPEWLTAFHSNERKVAKYRAGRVFLAGEAAHVHNPTGAQGMNTGIQDAINLAWKLALVCHRICPEEPLLDSYHSERSAVCDEILKNSSKLKPIAILRGEVKQSVRNRIASLLFGAASASNAAADDVTEIDYPDSPLTAQGASFRSGPMPGALAPVRKCELPFGAGDRPRFALCADVSTKEDEAPNLVEIYKDILEQEVRAPFADGGLWLVRPDGYVAMSAGRNDWDKVAAYLDQIHRGRRLMRGATMLPTWMRPRETS
jgi:2-polyprenyl-6-methoxyphenol hydroxylase-like FAD-dependent oxidoreductase